jgi:hypothetical protein
VCPINPTGIRICFACIIIMCEMLMLYSTLLKRSHACGGGSGFRSMVDVDLVAL